MKDSMLDLTKRYLSGEKLGPADFAQTLYGLMRKHINTGTSQAKGMFEETLKYGQRVEVVDLSEFYVAGKKLCRDSLDSRNWTRLSDTLLQGFVEAGKVRVASVAIAAMRFYSGNNATLEATLMKIALPLLREPSDIIDFGLAISSDRAFIMFNTMIGGNPGYYALIESRRAKERATEEQAKADSVASL